MSNHGECDPMTMKARKLPVEVEFRDAEPGEVIATLEGNMTANPGDVIITGVKGEQYPCARDIFMRTYSPTTELAKLWFQSARTNTSEGAEEDEG